MVKPTDKAATSKVVDRILRTAQLIDAFWERWVVHGIDQSDVDSVRKELTSYDRWAAIWGQLAEEKRTKAALYKENNLLAKAETYYRQASLYYNLVYWLDPVSSEGKIKWYKESLEMMRKADALSRIPACYMSIKVNDLSCKGRMRIPTYPKGCIIIINPIDSSKEELYQYEEDFISKGFVTLSFDGPGQGETFLLNGGIGTRALWEPFVDQVIDFAAERFPGLPIHLFGTSLGGSWVIYGSTHPKVSSAVAVSPAVALERMNMPSYFMDRMNASCLVDKSVHPIPELDFIIRPCPILIFHGKKDMMVPNDEMMALFQKLSSRSKMMTYKDAGHCCNYHLEEIRERSVQWFMDIEKIGVSEHV